MFFFRRTTFAKSKSTFSMFNLNRRTLLPEINIFKDYVFVFTILMEGEDLLHFANQYFLSHFSKQTRMTCHLHIPHAVAP